MNNDGIGIGSCRYVPLADYNWWVPGLAEKSPRCHGIALEWNPTVLLLFSAFFAVTIWVGLEVIIQAMTTFRRWATLYFWSIMFTACATVAYALAMVLMLFTDSGRSSAVKAGIYPTAWICTNVGFIAVLYSRLHLILDAPRALKVLAWVLIGIGIPFHIFLVVASSGVPFYFGMTTHLVSYRLEVIINLIEIAISAVYVYFFTVRFMKDGSGVGGTTRSQLRRTFIVLILGELFVVAGDIVIMTVWLIGYTLVRLAIGHLIYGLKLKVEFLILNQLTSMTQRRAELRHITITMGNDTNDDAVTAAAVAAATVLETAMGTQVGVEAHGVIEGKCTFDETPSDSSDRIWSGKDPVMQVDSEDAPSSSAVPAPATSQARDSFNSMERQYLGRSNMSRIEKMV